MPTGRGQNEKFFRQLEKQGAIIRKGGSHWVITKSGKGVVAIFTMGRNRDGDRRSHGNANILSQLRRAGFQV